MFFPKGPEDMPNPAELLSVSGLEFMRGVQEGRFPAAPIAEGLSYTLQVVEEGRVVFRGAPEFRHSNPMGSVHGGWYGVLLDSAMGCAVMTKLPKGQVYTTLEYKVNIIRAIKVGTLVDCEGVTDHVGRSTGVAHADIRGVEDGKLYATATTTCIVMTPGTAP